VAETARLEESDMKYRKFGKLNWKVSALGFGCMRFPTMPEDKSKIDEPEATRMLHYAIDHGLNYVDTAYTYHRGESERFLGRALKQGYREKVKLATKLPTWLVKTPEDFDMYLNEQLQRLQTDHIDLYLLHSLNKRTWSKVRDLEVLEWAKRQLADGRIHHLGFSFHDAYEVFKEIVDAHDWTFCQIQYNHMDVKYQAGTKGLKYAGSKGLAVVVMEPIMGGYLANPPRRIQRLWDTAAKKRTPADWALQWVWNQTEVSVVLSGMSTMEQVRENVASANASGVNKLTKEELRLITSVGKKYAQLRPIPCTGCEYCMPCPNGVDIPQNLRVYNDGMIYDSPDRARGLYSWMAGEKAARADSCIQCHQCEEKCPQKIPISDWMRVVHEVLGEGKPYAQRVNA
jgi:hypothetical protein